jgi:hypothetical protein
LFPVAGGVVMVTDDGAAGQSDEVGWLSRDRDHVRLEVGPHQVLAL